MTPQVLLVLACALGATSIAASSEIKSVTLNLEPSTCTTFQFTVPNATQFNLTVDTSGICANCDPTTTLMMTPMIRAGYCNAYKWNRLKCDEYIRNVGQVCAEWAELGEAFKPSNATADRSIYRTTYWECGKTEYFMAFQSSYAKPLSFLVSVEVQVLSDDEGAFCKYVGVKGKNIMEIITKQQIIAVLAIGLIAFGALTLCICFQAPCCPFNKWIKNFSMDPDELEEELLEQEDEERRERLRRRAAKKRREEKLRQSPIPEESV